MNTHQWSIRSQRSLLEEKQLKEDLERCHQLVIHFSKQVGDFETQVEYQTNLAVKGDGLADYFLTAKIADLQSLKLQLAAYREREASIQSKLDEIQNPSPARKEEIARYQGRLTELALQRLETDRRAERALTELLRLLQQRAGLTSAMTEAATGADFTLGPDTLDSVRFEEMLKFLPATLAVKSEAWLNLFLGTGY